MSQSALTTRKMPRSQDLATGLCMPRPRPKAAWWQVELWGEKWGPNVSSKGMLSHPCCPAPSFIFLIFLIQSFGLSIAIYLTSVLKCAKHNFFNVLRKLIFWGHFLSDGCSQELWDPCYSFPKFIISLSETSMWGKQKRTQTVPCWTCLASEWDPLQGKKLLLGLSA